MPHDSYVKLWTSIRRDPWFLSLKCNQRGFWIQLLVIAKSLGDDGKILGKIQWVANETGTDWKTAGKNLGKFQSDGKIEVIKHPGGIYEISVRNYEYYQQLHRPKTRKPIGKKPENSNGDAHTRLDKIRLDQTKRKTVAENGDDIGAQAKTFLAWFGQCYQDKFRSKYICAFKKDTVIVKDMLKALGMTELKARAERFLDDSDHFVIKAGHTIGVLKSRINSYVEDKRGCGKLTDSGGVRAEPGKYRKVTIRSDELAKE